MKKYAPNDIKFVVLLRDIQEVVASFIHWSENNKPNYINDSTDGSIKSKVDYVLRQDSELWRDYWSIVGAKDSGYPCFFIEYKNIHHFGIFINYSTLLMKALVIQQVDKM